MRNQAIFFICLQVLLGCHTSQKIAGNKTDSISQLKFLSEDTVAYGQQFNGTVIGGLSGIDYDAKRDVYYTVSDDRSEHNPARFYTAKIRVTDNKIDSVEFIDVKSLLQKDGTVYPNSKHDPYHTPDPEALRYNPAQDEFVWSSEGERIVRPGVIVLEDPSVIAINRNGNYKDSFALPANMHMQATEKGPRQNSVFEGVAFSGDDKYLFVSVEEPIYEDGPRADVNRSAWTRIIKFDAKTRMPIAQYAYLLEPVARPAKPPESFKINGIPDILCIGKNKLIVLERSFSTGTEGCTIRVFLADLNGATNIANVNSLQSQPVSKPIAKKLLLNMDDLGRYIDNIEGVTFGPVLPNGHRTLIFVADNNFTSKQKTQFLLFEVIP
jgi:hypothetical protein